MDGRAFLKAKNELDMTHQRLLATFQIAVLTALSAAIAIVVAFFTGQLPATVLISTLLVVMIFTATAGGLYAKQLQKLRGQLAAL